MPRKLIALRLKTEFQTIQDIEDKLIRMLLKYQYLFLLYCILEVRYRLIEMTRLIVITYCPLDICTYNKMLLQ